MGSPLNFLAFNHSAQLLSSIGRKCVFVPKPPCWNSNPKRTPVWWKVSSSHPHSQLPQHSSTYTHTNPNQTATNPTNKSSDSNTPELCTTLHNQPPTPKVGPIGVHIAIFATLPRHAMSLSAQLPQQTSSFVNERIRRNGVVGRHVNPVARKTENIRSLNDWGRPEETLCLPDRYRRRWPTARVEVNNKSRAKYWQSWKTYLA